jgi:hypothetical protein
MSRAERLKSAATCLLGRFSPPGCRPDAGDGCEKPNQEHTTMTIDRPMFPPVADSVHAFPAQPATRQPESETLTADSLKPVGGLSRRLMLAGLAAVGIPTSARVAARERDPIYDAIEKHRDACKARSAAVRADFGYEEETCCVGQMTPEQRRIYNKLEQATGDAWGHLDDVSIDLVTTKPTTLAGVIALCDYFVPLLNDPTLVDLPEAIAWDDDTETAIAAAFADVIAKSLRDIVEREVRS